MESKLLNLHRGEDVLFKNLHDPFSPHLVYSDSQLKCTVQRKKETLFFAVWSLSPVGGVLCGNPDTDFKIGESIRIKMDLMNQAFSVKAFISSIKENNSKQKLFGVRWENFSVINSEQSQEIEKERRTQPRWKCPPNFLPTGTAKNEVQFSEMMFFRALDVSLEGIQLSTSIRNSSLMPGMKLHLELNFPMVGIIDVSVLIQRCAIRKNKEDSFLYVGCKFVNPTQKLTKILGQYLYQFSDLSHKELKESGFLIQSLSKGVAIDIVRSKEDFNEVLNLRHKCYRNNGKIPEESTPLDTSDEFDFRSKIIIARKNNKIIGTGRLIFSKDHDLTEHEKYTKLPHYLPDKDEIVEVSKLCVDPDYQKGDIFYRLIQEIVSTIAFTNRKYILTNATKKMAKVYKKCGMQTLNKKFKHPELNNIEHFLLWGNVHEGISGRHINFFIWNFIYADLVDFIEKRNYFKPTKFAKVKLFIYRKLSISLNYFTDKVLKRSAR